MAIEKIVVESSTEISRARTTEEIAPLIGRLLTKEIPGFVVPTEVADGLGEDPFTVLTDSLGLRQVSGDLMRSTPQFFNNGILHTDPQEVGETHRLHRIRKQGLQGQAQAGAILSLGRLIGHEPSTKGKGYQPVTEDGILGAVIKEMHTGELRAGDVTVFELSPDVAHDFSNLSVEKRISDTRAIGPVS